MSAQTVIDQQLPDFYPQLKQQQQFSAAWHPGRYDDIRQWKTAARVLLRQSLLWPDNPVAFEPQLQQSEQRDGYRAERWLIQLTAESRVPVLILTPQHSDSESLNSELLPAILLLHDHGAWFELGKEKMIRPLLQVSHVSKNSAESAQRWADKHFSGQFVGDELARQGYLVIAADTFGWGERGPLAFEAQQAVAANFFLLGRSLAGMAAYEDLRLVEYIRQLPQVDAERIGVIGFSMGAFRAWQLAALTDDIRAAVAVSWFNTYQQLLVPGNNILRGQSAFYMLHPGLPALLDIPDVAAIAAPKAMLFINGARDRLMPVAGVEQAYARIREIWQQFQASEQLTTEIWPEAGHEFNARQQQRVYEWLAVQLKSKSSK